MTTWNDIHLPSLIKRPGETGLACTCGTWRGRAPADFEGHDAHRRDVRARALTVEEAASFVLGTALGEGRINTTEVDYSTALAGLAEEIARIAAMPAATPESEVTTR